MSSFVSRCDVRFLPSRPLFFWPARFFHAVLLGIAVFLASSVSYTNEANAACAQTGTGTLTAGSGTTYSVDNFACTGVTDAGGGVAFDYTNATGNASVFVDSGATLTGGVAIQSLTTGVFWFDIFSGATMTGAVDVPNANSTDSVSYLGGTWNVTSNSVYSGTIDQDGTINVYDGVTLKLGNEFLVGGEPLANYEYVNIGVGSSVFVYGDFYNSPGGSIPGQVTGASQSLFDVAGTADNRGIVTVGADGDFKVGADLLNSGTIYNGSGGTIDVTGDTSNLATGKIDLDNGGNSFSDSMTVAGTYTGTPGSQINVNVDLGNSSADTVSALEFEGQSSIIFNWSNPGFIKDPITIMDDTDDVDNLPDMFDATPIPDYGIITYSFDKEPSGDWVLSSGINDNSAANMLTNVTGALGNVSAGFHQPASNDVRCLRSGAKSQFCSGVWARTNAAQFDLASSSNVAYVSPGKRDLGTINTEQRLSYEGLQSGLDFGVLNLNGSGWDVHVGVTGGQISGDIDQIDGKLGNTEFDLPFVGIYTIVSNGSFTLDLTARKEFYDIELTNAAAGLDKEGVDGEADAYNATANYQISFGDSGVYLVPFAAVTYTKIEIDAFDIIGGRIKPGEEDSLMVRGGARLAAIVKYSDNMFVQPFIGVSGWQNFENETDAEFFTVNDALIRSETTSPETFLQVEAGVGGVHLEQSVSGYLRGVYRNGEDVEGYGVTVGARIDLSEAFTK